MEVQMESSIPRWVDYQPPCPIKRARYWPVGGYLQIHLQEDAEYREDGLPILFLNVPPWVGAIFQRAADSDLAEITVAMWAFNPRARPQSVDPDQQQTIDGFLNSLV